ncbi:hypothetical protein BVRB_9g202310 [Beta vulgaris subsp. vulgaris]|uniref:uncharacterized protein LOC104902514 n=1 Tax=Beta vulgaris subsp. vulgaris TaxID=3555 RepID=UPI000540165A|nr:uncharacterized protein LOC104902514 [Beta vulgaris subsp. vulgaris]KMT02544.1 hypothetical protein BVRB_9g202310 [Beta vulgaris subsp. vulgaris]
MGDPDPDQPKALAALDSSNIGFQLLKKHGWKEGTGLGASQQGRLEPVETYFKKNKRGVGAEKVKKKILHLSTTTPSDKEKPEKMSKKAKALSKRMRKMLDEEKRRQEMDLRQAFFREFWPDNV